MLLCPANMVAGEVGRLYDCRQEPNVAYYVCFCAGNMEVGRFVSVKGFTSAASAASPGGWKGAAAKCLATTQRVVSETTQMGVSGACCCVSLRAPRPFFFVDTVPVLYE